MGGATEPTISPAVALNQQFLDETFGTSIVQPTGLLAVGSAGHQFAPVCQLTAGMVNGGAAVRLQQEQQQQQHYEMSAGAGNPPATSQTTEATPMQHCGTTPSNGYHHQQQQQPQQFGSFPVTNTSGASQQQANWY